jgi:prepilin-type N-terminal cleavage/methylation domain-containing protein
MKKYKKLYKKGFTLLEVLVATAVLSIAITVILQLFSANIRNIAVSDDYVKAVTKAHIKMREILDESDITDKTYSEITNDGYKVDVSISEIAKDRSENLNVKLFEIDLKLSWLKGNKEKFINLKTMKLVGKKI